MPRFSLQSARSTALQSDPINFRKKRTIRFRSLAMIRNPSRRPTDFSPILAFLRNPWWRPSIKRPSDEFCRQGDGKLLNVEGSGVSDSRDGLPAVSWFMGPIARPACAICQIRKLFKPDPDPSGESTAPGLYRGFQLSVSDGSTRYPFLSGCPLQSSIHLLFPCTSSHQAEKKIHRIQNTGFMGNS